MNNSRKYENADIRRRSVTPMRIAKIGYIALSIVFCIVGVLLVAWSDIGTWRMILALAFLTVIAGVLLVFRPWESANILTVLLGISLLEEGVLNLCVAVSTVKIVKHQYSDVIDADFTPVETEDPNK